MSTYRRAAAIEHLRAHGPTPIEELRAAVAPGVTCEVLARDLAGLPYRDGYAADGTYWVGTESGETPAALLALFVPEEKKHPYETDHPSEVEHPPYVMERAVHELFADGDALLERARAARYVQQEGQLLWLTPWVHWVGHLSATERLLVVRHSAPLRVAERREEEPTRERKRRK